MHGVPRHLAWRDSIDRGDILGPRLFSAGPILDGDPPMRATNRVVRSVEDARAVVGEQLDAGYDFIKIYDNVSPAIYAAITAEARIRGRKVVGHLPTPVGLEGATTTVGQHGVVIHGGVVGQATHIAARDFHRVDLPIAITA